MTSESLVYRENQPGDGAECDMAGKGWQWLEGPGCMTLSNDIGAEPRGEQGEGEPGRELCRCPAVETCHPGAFRRQNMRGT